MKNLVEPAGTQGPERAFRERLAQGEFILQTCARCHMHVFYPRLLCPSCGSRDMQSSPSTLHGVVYSTTTVRQKPEAGGDYNIALINLDEGPRLMSRVVGIPPREVRIGARVQGRIVQQDGEPIVVFECVGGGISV